MTRDIMRELVWWARGKGWHLVRHMKPAKIDRSSNPMDEVGLDRFQFVRKDGAKYYSNTRRELVRLYLLDVNGLLEKMEGDGIR